MVDAWLATMDTVCTGSPCTEQCLYGIRDDVVELCMGADPLTCRDLCPRYEEARGCFECLGDSGTLEPDLATAWEMMELSCADECWFTCVDVAAAYTDQCAAIDEACEAAMCTDDRRTQLQECSVCLSGSSVTNHLRDVIQAGITDMLNMCGEPTGGPEEVTCDEECTEILNRNNEMCTAGDKESCKGMCSVSPLPTPRIP